MSDGRADARARLTRLARGGAPSIASSAVVAVVPLTGAFVLDSDEYAIWALAATLSTIFIVFDFGTTSLSTKLAAERNLDGRTLAKLLLITAAPPILLGVGTVAIWPWYSSAAHLVGASRPEVYILLASVALGTICRSLGVVFAAIALGREDYARRAVILVTGAVAQLLGTLLSLSQGLGYTALGIGVVAGGVTQLIVGLVLERGLDVPSSSHVDISQLVRRFAKSKGIGTGLGLIATQLDRWALGLAATPALLTTYDLATRIATIPKIALLALAAGLVSESARTLDLNGAKTLLRSSQRVTVGFYVLASVGTATASIMLLSGREQSAFVVPIVLMVTVAHGVNAATIPGALILTGGGRPDFELRYLYLLAGTCIAVYAAGVFWQEGLIIVIGWAAAMCAASAFFLQKSPGYIKEVWHSAK